MLCTVDKLNEFISHLSVNMISCFEVKPRRRYNEDVSNVNRKAFRVCVYEDDCTQFLNPDAWPHSVKILEWFLKRKPDGTGNGDGCVLVVVNMPLVM